MMTPKEKAKQLFDKFYYVKDEQGFHSVNKYRAKQCALIAVNEILDFMLIELKWDEKYNGNVIYWKEVKQEIEKL